MTAKVFPAKAALVIANPKSKLLDQLREVLRVKHYSLRPEEAYVQWTRRFLKFHQDQTGVWRHPRDLGAAEVVAFLNHLANVQHVACGHAESSVKRNLISLYAGAAHGIGRGGRISGCGQAAANAGGVA